MKYYCLVMLITAQKWITCSILSVLMDFIHDIKTKTTVLATYTNMLHLDSLS